MNSYDHNIKEIENSDSDSQQVDKTELSIISITKKLEDSLKSENIDEIGYNKEIHLALTSLISQIKPLFEAVNLINDNGQKDYFVKFSKGLLISVSEKTINTELIEDIALFFRKLLLINKTHYKQEIKDLYVECEIICSDKRIKENEYVKKVSNLIRYSILMAMFLVEVIKRTEIDSDVFIYKQSFFSRFINQADVNIEFITQEIDDGIIQMANEFGHYVKYNFLSYREISFSLRKYGIENKINQSIDYTTFNIPLSKTVSLSAILEKAQLNGFESIEGIYISVSSKLLILLLKKEDSNNQNGNYGIVYFDCYLNKFKYYCDLFFENTKQDNFEKPDLDSIIIGEDEETFVYINQKDRIIEARADKRVMLGGIDYFPIILGDPPKEKDSQKAILYNTRTQILKIFNGLFYDQNLRKTGSIKIGDKAKKIAMKIDPAGKYLAILKSEIVKTSEHFKIEGAKQISPIVGDFDLIKTMSNSKKTDVTVEDNKIVGALYLINLSNSKMEKVSGGTMNVETSIIEKMSFEKISLESLIPSKLTFSSDGILLAVQTSFKKKKYLSIFNLENMIYRGNILLPDGIETRIFLFSPNNKFLLMLGKKNKDNKHGFFYLFDLTNKGENYFDEEFMEDEINLNSIEFSPDSNYLYYGGISGELHIINLLTGEIVVNKIGKPISKIVIDKNNGNLLLILDNKEIMILPFCIL